MQSLTVCSEGVMFVLKHVTNYSNVSQHNATLEENSPIEEIFPTWAIVLQSSVLALVCVTALVSNFIVSFTLLKKEQLVVPSNRLVFSLTSSNFALALLVLPFTVVSSALQQWRFGTVWCNFTAFFALLVGCSTFLTVGVIALDRYYAIVKPMMYTLTITNSRITCVLMVVWFLGFLCALPPFFGWSEFYYRDGICMVDWGYSAVFTAFVIAIAVFPPFVTVIVCYYVIFQVARSTCRKVHIGVVSDVANDMQLAPAPTSRRLSTRRWSMSRKSSSVLPSYVSPAKGLRTVCVVVGVFTVTCIPYVSVAVSEAVSGSGVLPAWYRILALWLALLSIATHPVVYGLYNRSIRKQLRECLCPTASTVLQGLPRVTSQRLSISASISGSVFDYSPFKFRLRRNSRRTSMEYSRASLDASTRTVINGRRKGSHDSGAVVTDSDADPDVPFFSLHRWRRRFSAPSQLQFFSAGQDARQPQPASLPLLQSLASAALTKTSSNNQRSRPLESTTSETSFISDEMAVTVEPADNLLDIVQNKLSSGHDKDVDPHRTDSLQQDEKVFLRVTVHQTSVDEGISLTSDCALQELE